MIKSHLHNNDIQLTHVVAFDNNHCIGSDNQLPWHIPEDLAHFKRLTKGGVVLMGRKTFESIGKPLPNRTNWVITSDTTWQHPTVKTAHTLHDGLLLAINDVKNSNKPNQLFVIGGGQVYRQTLDIASTLQVTHVDTTIHNPDAFYPNIPFGFEKIDQSDRQTDEKSGIEFYFATYKKSS